MNKHDIKKYEKILNNNPVKRPIVKNAICAFIFGGCVGLIGQGIIYLFNNILDIELKTSQSLMSLTIVGITSLLTALGLFDKIGQRAGAGTYIPISGFANSMTSSAIEGKSEGVILGIMSNMFKLAGAVIVAGVVSAFISSSLIYLIRWLV